MKWEDYKTMIIKEYEHYGYEEIDVECPVCGKNIYKNTMFVLTTFPPQREYICFNCNWRENTYG